ncbi:MAG: preprotein translocase subunit SecA [Planctomycetota bacterium]|nr:MAG: preprotein translocase subunit SecA [Planctomycetota bacterium]
MAADGCSDWQRTLQNIATAENQLRRLTDPSLSRVADLLRQRAVRGDVESYEVLAVAREAVRRTLGLTLFDVQLRAADAMIRRRIVEMQTGEGKTLAAFPAAVWMALRGQGVHVATSTEYLAHRDCELLRPAYELLGLSVATAPADTTAPTAKQAAYDCDVTYVAASELGFDFLRDRVRRRETGQFPLGHALLDCLQGTGAGPQFLITRGCRQVIVDEADNVLIDDASSPLVLASGQDGTPGDVDLLLRAQHVARSLCSPHHFQIMSGDRIQLTAAGLELAQQQAADARWQASERSWSDYVLNALRANYLLRRDEDYVVRDGLVLLVDRTTGVIHPNRFLRGGLHQALQAKEGVPLRAGQSAVEQILRQHFFLSYDRLSGMTGTAVDCQAELASVYGVHVEVIPPRLPSARKEMPLRAFACREAKLEAICQSVRERQQRGQPVLIGTRTIEASEDLASRLRDCGLHPVVLNGKQDASEAEIIAAAGRSGALTIATNLAGRGTDIRLDERARQAGGLHVIVEECHPYRRMDRQLIGRCARQGDPGSCQVFVSADDWLLQHRGRWLAEILQRSHRGGECDWPIGAHIRRLQQTEEQRSRAARERLLRQCLDQRA